MAAIVLLELKVGLGQIVGAPPDVGACPPPPLLGPLAEWRPFEPSRGIAGQWIDDALAWRLESGRFQPHRRARDRAARVDDQIGLDHRGLAVIDDRGVAVFVDRGAAALARRNRYADASRPAAVARNFEPRHRDALAQFDLGQLAEKIAHARFDKLAARAEKFEVGAVTRLPSLRPQHDEIPGMVVKRRAFLDREALEAGKRALVLPKPAHQQAVHVARLRDTGAILDAFGKAVAVEHGDVIKEIAQHAAGEQTREASADYDCVRAGHQCVSDLARPARLERLCAPFNLRRSARHRFVRG